MEWHRPGKRLDYRVSPHTAFSRRVVHAVHHVTLLVNGPELQVDEAVLHEGGIDIVCQLLDDGAVGELRTMQAEYGEYLTADHRIMGLSWAAALLRVTLQPQMLGRLSASV